ncbi:cytochrome P-450 cyp509A1 [Cunninghamella echinulata]|nr:cytochrome P-450 cyp509A1 [Cunninghamella echinulata]
MSQFISTVSGYWDSRFINQQAWSRFYETYLLKYTDSKAKRLTIGASISLILLGYGLKQLVTPPKQLRHIKHTSFLKYIYNFIIKKPYTKEMHTVISKNIVEETNGLYLQLERTGWVVHVANPDAVKQVLLKSDVFPKFDLSKLAAEKDSFLVQFFGLNNILATNGAEWLKHRKLTNPAFHRSLPAKLFGETVQGLFKIWDNAYDDKPFEIDINHYTERATLDIIGKAGFGFDFNAVADEQSPWKKTYDTLIEASGEPLFFMFPILEKKFLWLFPKRQESFKKLDEWKAMLTSVIENKRRLLKDNIDQGVEEAEKDLLTLMIESEFRGEGILTKEELISDLTIFFAAGHDTTSFALTSAIYFLSKYPDIQEKARQEVNSTLCPNGEPNEDILPTIEDTKKLVYINMIMKETMRISNSVLHLVTPRVATQDVNLNGTFIPKGTQVNVNIYGLHHSSKVWDDPETFNPDRFAPGGEAEKQNGIAWVPFSNGSRQCIGMNFSLLEQRVILSCLLRKYEWTLPENSIHKDHLVSIYDTLPRPVDVKIRFKRRY